MSTASEPLETAIARHGGEDPVIRARDRFRKVTQGALEEFQREVLDTDPGDDPVNVRLAEAHARFRTRTLEAGTEFRRVISALTDEFPAHPV
ncbi:MAG TPA: hypothetical protein VD862_00715 [Candidatus Paceibacterota bacterium]|nr:hypothetical protein [Candidatus Paceibacterota bacterium]